MAADEDLAALLARVAASCDAPRPLVAAMAASLIDAPARPPGDRLEAMLRRQLGEHASLRARLATRSGDAAVDALRARAVQALEAGRFGEADGGLAEAERYIFAVTPDLAAMTAARRATAVGLRADRGAIAALRLGPQAAREAARRYAEAAVIAGEADPERRLRCRLTQAELLARLGADFVETAAFSEAIALLRDVLAGLDRSLEPVSYATVQERIGLALLGLRGLDGDNGHLRAAVASYRDALHDLRKLDDAVLWQRLQRRLGLAAIQLGEIARDPEPLEEGVKALRLALGATSREADENGWARAQVDFARALMALGQHISDTARIEEAIGALRAALGIWTCEARPREWSELQDRLGQALGAMAQRYGEPIIIEEAIAAFDAALGQRPRETQPLLWATSTANRGDALLQLAARRREPALAETGVRQLMAAIEALRAAGLAESARPIEGRLEQAAALIKMLRAPGTGGERRSGRPA
jgi:tetratricopeptide (TPR) repeat protein